jgi:hypothetical protein
MVFGEEEVPAGWLSVTEFFSDVKYFYQYKTRFFRRGFHVIHSENAHKTSQMPKFSRRQVLRTI